MFVIAALIVFLHVPLGNYMARVYSADGSWAVERVIYRIVGVAPGEQQRWTKYLSAVLAFSAVGVLFLFGLLLLQVYLPEPWGHKGMTPALAFNTAISFTTNTSWQNYPGEATLGHVGLVAGLGVQAFASLAVGMCVAVALIRGLAQYQNSEIGNFWVDLVRTVVRILLPLSVIVTLILLALGVVNNVHGAQEVSTVAGGGQTLLGGPVATWESIKLMSGDGGGAFNVNSAHPFENPTPLTNVVEIVAMLLIPVAFLRTFGVMVGDRKQGWALFAVVATLFAVTTLALAVATSVPHGTVVSAVGGPVEGTEMRFGVPGSAVFGQAATATGDGAANASYDSFASLGGAVLMLNMMLGEVAPGGAGSGLYGLVMMVLLAVFLGGLMVGTTPEYLRQRLQARHMKLVSLYILALPAAVLVGTAIAMAMPGQRATMLNSGPHGLSEVLYAFTSSAANNGSGFAGLSGNTTWYNVALAIAMVIGRFLPIIAVLGIAGTFAAQRPGVVTAGTLRTHTPTFVVLTLAATLLLVGLEYLPALVVGPIADALT
ncbi:potassium-transporting ATPase subunit KdpA [Mycobacterium sp. CBMA247]|nr:potassium-transporting ATPase subunit KdpA [Mycolicibacterium sp. CBMA 329]MUL91209.1 potassium-transporting ATPase subunit KdpA [Mycolicibacterium sp. CBMA 331]MUL98122.1 potassium-transporting ATPase subunit KdpA [Mycolicibacterium sp. CBMA 334]MUM25778.1 potassium-transporting ATPase subunit KdpA [Mycolicibacterium sp. CBMA 295]MUM40968.1 potassium-transporting ATPase subunit KdpA [Mycolicibacterium sp. CBMA 247]MUM47164.1 potassium-transporting ATPase subunit KdpA [Mycolicibacterium sp.